MFFRGLTKDGNKDVLNLKMKKIGLCAFETEINQMSVLVKICGSLDWKNVRRRSWRMRRGRRRGRGGQMV